MKSWSRRFTVLTASHCSSRSSLLETQSELTEFWLEGDLQAGQTCAAYIGLDCGLCSGSWLCGCGAQVHVCAAADGGQGVAV